MGPTAIHAICDAAEAHPGRPALHCHDGRLTYRELLSQARQVATLASSVPRGSRIGIVTGDDTLTYASLLGCWLAGCAYVPLNVGDPPARHAAIMADADLALVLSSRPLAAVAATAEAAGVRCEVPDLVTLAPCPDLTRLPADDSPAYVLFTSGSTGTPKGVPITHGNLTAFLRAWHADPGYTLSGDDRFLQMFEQSFDLSVMSFVTPLSIGASCHVVPARGISYVNTLRILRAERITVSMMVPSVLAYLAPYFHELRLPHLRYSLFAGEALPRALVREWQTCVPNALIQNSYGPTETTIICSIHDLDRHAPESSYENGIVPIGRPMAGNGFLVLGPGDRPVADGEEGELCIFGPQVTSGYLNQAEKNAQSFLELQVEGRQVRLYRTGDLVVRRLDGVLHWRMRKDHQVKIDGHRIELGEIESHAREFSGAGLVAAVTKSDAVGHLQIALYVQGGSRTEDELRIHLAEVLPAYMRPKTICVIAQMPMSSAGKVDRVALRAL